LAKTVVFANHVEGPVRGGPLKGRNIFREADEEKAFFKEKQSDIKISARHTGEKTFT